MLFEVNQKKKDINLSVIRGGLDTSIGAICADCGLCGTKGNDRDFLIDKTS